MLIARDRSMLGDGTLDFKESMMRYTAGTEAMKSDKYRMYDHNILKNIERRAGQRMQASEFIYLIKEMNPTIWIEQQINFPDDWGMYTDVFGRKTYLTSFSKHWIPEWTYILLDEAELVGGRVKGWRNCLTELLHWGAITWDQVVKVFSDGEGKNAYRWAEMVRPFRSEDCSKHREKAVENKMDTIYASSIEEI